MVINIVVSIIFVNLKKPNLMLKRVCTHPVQLWGWEVTNPLKNAISVQKQFYVLLEFYEKKRRGRGNIILL